MAILREYFVKRSCYHTLHNQCADMICKIYTICTSVNLTSGIISVRTFCVFWQDVSLASLE